jgi:flagellar protein FliL
MAEQAAKKSGGVMELLVPLVVVTALGGGGGWFLGGSALAPPERAEATSRDVESAEGKSKETSKSGHGDAGAHGKAAREDEHGKAPGRHGGEDESLTSKELPAIVTNLGAGRNWVRLQAAMIFDPHDLKHPEQLVVELTADLTAFINTLDVRDIEGADGLRRLQEELNERARIRSEGHVRELIVETLVIQ